MHVVDSSADFRYAAQADFESVYNVKHGAPDLLPEFQCGVPEHVPNVNKPHIGHPGCFATAVLLAAVPLLAAQITNGELFVTGVTGSTGSGKNPDAGTHHPERHSNLYAYKPLSHRHTPEIVSLAAAASGIDASINFVPHSGPYARGIYATVQAKTKRPVAQNELQELFVDAYENSAFVEPLQPKKGLSSAFSINRVSASIRTRSEPAF